MKKLLLILLCLPMIGFGQWPSVGITLFSNSGLEAMIIGVIVGLTTVLVVILIRASKKKALDITKAFKESSQRNDAISKLKSKLSSIELQITSFKKIKETGQISAEEENEWLSLAREHQKITNQIKELNNPDSRVSNKDNSQITEIKEMLINSKKKKYKISFKTILGSIFLTFVSILLFFLVRILLYGHHFLTTSSLLYAFLFSVIMGPFIGSFVEKIRKQ